MSPPARLAGACDASDRLNNFSYRVAPAIRNKVLEKLHLAAVIEREVSARRKHALDLGRISNRRRRVIIAKNTRGPSAVSIRGIGQHRGVVGH